MNCRQERWCAFRFVSVHGRPCANSFSINRCRSPFTSIRAVALRARSKLVLHSQWRRRRATVQIGYQLPATATRPPPFRGPPRQNLSCNVEQTRVYKSRDKCAILLLLESFQKRLVEDLTLFVLHLCYTNLSLTLLFNPLVLNMHERFLCCSLLKR